MKNTIIQRSQTETVGLAVVLPLDICLAKRNITSPKIVALGDSVVVLESGALGGDQPRTVGDRKTLFAA